MASVAAAWAEIEAAKLPCRLMIDTSHAKSAKQYQRQVDVARDVGAEAAAPRRRHDLGHPLLGIR